MEHKAVLIRPKPIQFGKSAYIGFYTVRAVDKLQTEGRVVLAKWRIERDGRRLIGGDLDRQSFPAGGCKLFHQLSTGAIRERESRWKRHRNREITEPGEYEAVFSVTFTDGTFVERRQRICIM